MMPIHPNYRDTDLFNLLNPPKPVKRTKMADGSVMEEDPVHGAGYGKRIFPDEKVMEGRFKHGNLEGHGTVTGKWSDESRHGTYKYDGNFRKSGMTSGIEKYNCSTGELTKYIGTFSPGGYLLSGKIIWATEDETVEHEGDSFHNEALEGRGKITTYLKSGEKIVLEGEFYQGQLVPGTGTQTTSNVLKPEERAIALKV